MDVYNSNALIFAVLQIRLVSLLSEMESMDARLVAQALNYHGQQLQKVWEGERNENELVMLNLKDPSFEIYQQRQKTLRYIDRLW